MKWAKKSSLKERNSYDKLKNLLTNSRYNVIKVVEPQAKRPPLAPKTKQLQPKNSIAAEPDNATGKISAGDIQQAS